jgi:hypothetical protein
VAVHHVGGDDAEQGVAVGLGAGDDLGADDAGAAGAVLDDDGLGRCGRSASPSARARMSVPPPAA